LAKKLKECNVFGVSSDEVLNFAESNRREWEQRGQDIVAGYIKDRESGIQPTEKPLREIPDTISAEVEV
jgi:hypothetical protein